jgi:MFS family permease
MNTVAPVGLGYFTDRFGPKMTNMLGSILFSISGMLFSVSLLYSMSKET